MELTPYQVQKLLPTLPSCVSYIRICSLYCPRKQPDPIFTSENAKKLKEFCPHLETLIIENAFLATYKTVTDIAVENLPQKVCVLSLRGSIFRTHYFFSNVNTCQNIKILDFSSCICIRDNHLGCFSKMRSLEELYLAGCQIHNQGIKILLDTSEKSTVLRLKVLDLEATEITDEIIMVLQERLVSLEKLFLRRTQITDDSFAFVDKYSFEKLNTLCLQDTNMTSAGIRPLLKLKSIKFINLSVEVLKSNLLEIHPALRRVLRFKNEEAADSLFCDHFMKRNICAFQ